MRVASVEEAAELLASGEVVGLPTDTVYGLAADPLSEGAMQKLYELKGRPANKPVGFLAADIASAQQLVVMRGWAIDLANDNWPGPLTIVGKAVALLPNWSGKRFLRTIGVRVPDHEITRQLLRLTGPLAVTSANLSGGQECNSHDEAGSIFGDSVAGYVGGRSPGGVASTVVDATQRKPKVIRQGPVSV